MDLKRINDVVSTFGLSSRTLRYYEEAGILWSTHPDSKAQRWYDEAALDRLKQIIVLRKLQIPIRDIATIFKDNSMASVIRAFTDKLASLDGEISALSELRQLVDDFLQKMLSAGIKKISAITLLYEETEKRLSTVEDSRAVTYDRLHEVNREAKKLRDVRVIRLPAMRVLTSRMKNGQLAGLDADSMENLFSVYGFIPTPGLRDCFFLKKPNDIWLMAAKIPDDFANTTPYTDSKLSGGLYAVVSTFMEDMDETFGLLREWVVGGADYGLDTDESGTMRRDEMIEELMPWDIARAQNRFQQDVFIPIRLKYRGDDMG